MFDVLLIGAVLLLTGTTLVLLIKREHVLRLWLNRPGAPSRDQSDAGCAGDPVLGESEQKVLDSVESEDLEIAANLDRMNLLLDRLNGILRGRAEPEQRRARHIIFREEPLPMGWMLDFTSPDELQKFGNLPPITEAEVRATDWDCLFEQLRSDEMQ
jgi:hypothetical protein